MFVLPPPIGVAAASPSQASANDGGDGSGSGYESDGPMFVPDTQSDSDGDVVPPEALI